jgi:hypothetical protein
MARLSDQDEQIRSRYYVPGEKQAALSGKVMLNKRIKKLLDQLNAFKSAKKERKSP